MVRNERATNLGSLQQDKFWENKNPSTLNKLKG